MVFHYNPNPMTNRLVIGFFVLMEVLMMHRFSLLIGFIVFTATSVSPAQENQTKAQSLRVMSFNILNGGEQRGQPLEQTAAAIKAAKADIVGLQETHAPAPGKDVPRPNHAAKLAQLLGWHYLDQGARTGIISRHKITGHTPRKWGAAIELPDGRTVHLFNAHFNSAPYQPYQLLNIPYGDGQFITTAAQAVDEARKARGKQVDAMLAEVEEHAADSSAVFITGDFNEPSHLDWTDDVAKAGKCPLPVVWPATKAVTGAGFVDAYRAANPNPLTHPGLTWTPTTAITDPNDRHDRIDFVFARGKAIQIKSAAVVGESKTFADVVLSPYPSDHRAVVAEIELPKSSTK